MKEIINLIQKLRELAISIKDLHKLQMIFLIILALAILAIAITPILKILL